MTSSVCRSLKFTFILASIYTIIYIGAGNENDARKTTSFFQTGILSECVLILFIEESVYVRFMCVGHDVKHRRAGGERDRDEKSHSRECCVGLENRDFFQL